MGIIAIETEGTQIHILGDVLVAVASLDLKVPKVPNDDDDDDNDVDNDDDDFKVSVSPSRYCDVSLL